MNDIRKVIEQLCRFIKSCGVDDENCDIVLDYGNYTIIVTTVEDYDKLVKAFKNIDPMNKRIKIQLAEDDYGITETGELSPVIIKRETLISDEWEEIYNKMHKHRREMT